MSSRVSVCVGVTGGAITGRFPDSRLALTRADGDTDAHAELRTAQPGRVRRTGRRRARRAYDARAGRGDRQGGRGVAGRPGVRAGPVLRVRAGRAAAAPRWEGRARAGHLAE